MHWLDELLAEEDDVIPPVGGGIEISEGSRARGGSEAPEGSQAPGGGQAAPHIIADDEEDGAPWEGSVPSGPQEGERMPGGGSGAPPQPEVPEGSIEPRPVSGAEGGSSAEVPRAKTTVEVPTPTAGETGHRTAPGAPGGSQGAPGSQKKAVPRARCV